MTMAVRQCAAVSLVVLTSMSLAACGGETKPSQASVKAGMTRALQQQTSNSSSDKNAAARLAGCIVDGTYSKLSAKALKAIAQDQEQAKVLTHDESIMMDLATDGCANKLAR